MVTQRDKPSSVVNPLVDDIKVNNNGVISFVQELRTYRPSDFPLKDPTPIVAPYWADVDVDKVGGVVWYRETNDSDILAQANQDVHSYSTAYRKFRARWAFVATWDNVGFYGATNEGKNRCVLVSDGTQSFVIINYHKIEWTTGSNSHGTPETGLGGNPAQAGFNAGDGVNYYEIDGARTAAVINLTRTSNVCKPGRWIFRVDSPSIQSNSGQLYMSPSSGSMLGGYEVNITGPCFEASSSVRGYIKEANTTFSCSGGTSDGLRTVQCVMPTVFMVGPVTVTVFVDDREMNYTGEFTLVNAAQTGAAVRRHSPTRWTVGQEDLRVSWKRSLFPDDSTVEVEVMVFRMEGGIPKLEALVGTVIEATNTDQKVQITLPESLPVDISLAVVRVKVSYTLINGSYLSHWSDVFPVRWSNPAESDNWCSGWLSQEQSRSPLQEQAACPCTRYQAESDTGRWQKDPMCSADSMATFNCVFRGDPSTLKECLVPNYNGDQTVNQLCCYGKNDELLDIREGGGGSTLQRYHYRSRGSDVIPWFTYLREDVLPYLQCCEYSSSARQKELCGSYQQLRQPVSCQGYNPPAAAQAAGDPHLVTPDGVNYTFNGEGDFVLLQDHADPESARVKVHVHASRAIDTEGVLQNATVFTAVAMAVQNETAVVEIKKHPDEVAIVLVDKEEPDVTSWPHEVTGMTIYRNEMGNGTVEFTVVMETVGISILVSATPDLLNVMVLVGSSELKGNLTGLLGNYNGEKEDDFVARDGSQIPINANMSTVHYQFGMTWLLGSNETLLSNTDEPLETTANQSRYVPEFFDELPQDNLRNDTSDVCGDNLQCIFDYQLTNNKAIAESTKKFNDRFQAVVNEIAPVVRCPYVENIANGTRQVDGYAVGSVVYFSCHENFETNGSTKLTCRQDGTWSGRTPDCVEKTPIQETRRNLEVIFAVAGGVGGVVVVVLMLVLVKFAITKCVRRKHFAPDDASVCDTEGAETFELPVFFPPSDIPNPPFQNDRFLQSLSQLKAEGGKFRIPRPRFVDPNIYTEYF
ncbi:hypothetical protein BaRGS_00034663 [Batillaria attramentaria]|uniref:Sushi domain-containing protein 2-like n=1 Tax=Batillaria attramentaria TaxID=370345 RepID=A0ABD0JGR1_9CAEN